MERIDSAEQMRVSSDRWRAQGLTIGLVPTMGALHDGHLSLIHEARCDVDRVVVSIFVNPKQFGEGEDFNRYPRSLGEDLLRAQKAGADAVLVPQVDDIYPPGFQTTVSVGLLTERWCGRSRPGHFDGVTTVVARLFGLVAPHRAYFGQKDFQQVAVIRRMVADLMLPLEVVACPIVREPDGLAMSSRNRYLDADQRRRALSLSQALALGADRVQAGEQHAGPVLAAMRERLQWADVDIDYLAAVDPESLLPVNRLASGSVLLVAARFGETRLIDNRILL